MTGTCPVCGQRIPIVHHAVERPRDRTLELSWEVGYLARHGRPGVRIGAKCRGSFGSWIERQ